VEIPLLSSALLSLVLTRHSDLLETMRRATLPRENFSIGGRRQQALQGLPGNQDPGTDPTAGGSFTCLFSRVDVQLSSRLSLSFLLCTHRLLIAQMGSIPRSMVVVLEDDLVDICKAGDDVTVNGVVMRRWRPVDESKRFSLPSLTESHRCNS